MQEQSILEFVDDEMEDVYYLDNVTDYLYNLLIILDYLYDLDPVQMEITNDLQKRFLGN